MPYATTGGTYNNVAGATTQVAGNIIQSATWDNIHTDIGNALTQVMQQLISSISERNALYMNGSFEVWQRGSSVAVAATSTLYTADRWFLNTGGTQASTVAQATGLSNNSRFAAVVGRNNGQAGVTAMQFCYPLDTDEIIRLRGSKVTLSFLIKAGANWSPASGTIGYAVMCGTGANPAKRAATPYAGESQPINTTSNLTAGGATTAIIVSSSVVIPTNTTQMEIQFYWTPVGTAGAADNFTVDDVQLEAQLSVGTWTPTNFDRIPFDRQLQACQRHYAKTFNYATAPAQNVGVADTGALNQLSLGAARNQVYWEYPVRLRVGPTGTNITTYNPGATNANWRDVTAGADLAVGVDTNTDGNEQGIVIYSAAAAADNHSCVIHVTASAGI